MAARLTVGATGRHLTVVALLARAGLYVVAGVHAGDVPRRIYWTHTQRGWAVGPDGAPLGMWADELITVRQLLPGRAAGPAIQVRIADITSVARPVVGSAAAMERDCA